MDIVLIRPAYHAMKEFIHAGGNQHPINLLYLQGVLKQRGFSVSVLDLQVEKHDDDSLRQLFRSRYPKAVGVTVMTPCYGSAMQISRLAKEEGITVIWGGAHPSAVPHETLENAEVDIVVRGEGEISLAQVMGRLTTGESLEGIDGVSFKKDGHSIHNPPRAPMEDLDKLPLPERKSLPLHLYRGVVAPGIPKKSTVMFTARGCPATCIFCASNIVHGRKYRYRSIENIMEEVG